MSALQKPAELTESEWANILLALGQGMFKKREVRTIRQDSDEADALLNSL